MHTRLSTRLAGALALALAPIAAPGCGGGPALVPVTGTVTLNGQPLEGATVLFTPAGGGAGSSATDVTGPEGNYTLMTQGRTGVVPGKYLVLVSKEHMPAAVNADAFVMVDEAGNPIGADTDMMRMAQESLTEVGSQAPAAKAVKAQESGEREVPPEGAVFDFDLKASAADAAKLRAG